MARIREMNEKHQESYSKNETRYIAEKGGSSMFCRDHFLKSESIQSLVAPEIQEMLCKAFEKAELSEIQSQILIKEVAKQLSEDIKILLEKSLNNKEELQKEIGCNFRTQAEQEAFFDQAAQTWERLGVPISFWEELSNFFATNPKQVYKILEAGYYLQHYNNEGIYVGSTPKQAPMTLDQAKNYLENVSSQDRSALLNPDHPKHKELKEKRHKVLEFIYESEKQGESL